MATTKNTTKKAAPKVETKPAEKKEVRRGLYGIFKGKIHEAPGDIYNLSL
jgi:hypothetical protein